MAIQNAVVQVERAGNGVATEFSFEPLILPTKSRDLRVTLVEGQTKTVLTEGVDYLVEVTKYPGTGSIEYISNTPLSSDQVLLMDLDLDYSQTSRWRTQASFSPKVLERALDYLTLLVAQTDAKVQETREFTGVPSVTNADNGSLLHVASGVWAKVSSLSATIIGSGVFAAARIPALAASKITSGVFDAARIPALTASKITSGVFDAARIPALAASKITSGVFDAARIPEISLSKLASSVVARLLPTGGTVGQVPKKTATGVEWDDDAAGGGSSTESTKTEAEEGSGDGDDRMSARRTKQAIEAQAPVNSSMAAALEVVFRDHIFTRNFVSSNTSAEGEAATSTNNTPSFGVTDFLILDKDNEADLIDSITSGDWLYLSVGEKRLLAEIVGVQDETDNSDVRLLWYKIPAWSIGLDQYRQIGTGSGTVRFSRKLFEHIAELRELLSTGTSKTDGDLSTTTKMLLENFDNVTLGELVEWHDEHHTGKATLTGYRFVTGNASTAGDVKAVVSGTSYLITINPLSDTEKASMKAKLVAGRQFRLELNASNYLEGTTTNSASELFGKLTFNIRPYTLTGALTNNHAAKLQIDSSIPARDQLTSTSFKEKAEGAAHRYARTDGSGDAVFQTPRSTIRASGSTDETLPTETAVRAAVDAVSVPGNPTMSSAVTLSGTDSDVITGVAAGDVYQVLFVASKSTLDAGNEFWSSMVLAWDLIASGQFRIFPEFTGRVAGSNNGYLEGNEAIICNKSNSKITMRMAGGWGSNITFKVYHFKVVGA